MLRSSSDDRSRDEEPRSGGDRDVTYLAPGFRVDGELESPGDLRIAGRVEGMVRARGEVVVAENGEVDAEVHAATVVVAGRLAGTVHASERATFRKGCRVDGDVYAPVVGLEEGGRLTGRLHMSGEEPAAGSSTGGSASEEAKRQKKKGEKKEKEKDKEEDEEEQQTALALDVTFVGECVDAALDEAEESDVDVHAVLDALRRLQHAVPEDTEADPKARAALKKRLVKAIRTAHEEEIPVDEAVEKALEA